MGVGEKSLGLSAIGNPTACPRTHCDIGLLVGIDMVELHRQIDGQGPPPGVEGPHTIKNPLGWCVVGPDPIDYVEDDIEPASVSQAEPPHCFTVFKLPSEDDEGIDETLDDASHRSPLHLH